MTYPTRTFDLPALEGISDEQIKVHLGLYEGYVKHTNLIMEKMKALKEADAEGNAYTINELRRRFAFEFDGMRMHEYYFEQLEGGAKAMTADGALTKAAEEKCGSREQFMANVKGTAGSRGIGWVVVYADPRPVRDKTPEASGSPEASVSNGARAQTFHTVFVNDHELGQLAGLPIILALDLWEHAFMVDYRPATKKDYVEAFFANVNWSVVEKRFDEAMATSAA